MLTGEDLAWWLREHAPQCIATGFYEIDRLTYGGLRAGDISIVGAATGQGKSAFGEELALRISRYEPVLYLPLEMGEKALLMRLASKIEGISLATLQRLGAAHHETVRDLNVRKLIAWEFDAEPTVERIVTAAASSEARVVIIDHVRHIEGWLPDSDYARRNGPTRIVRRLAVAARELGIHIVLCAQLNRNAYDPKSKRPTMSQLQDTSALEQIAALVLLLHRPFYQRGMQDTITELLVPKNRYGPPCMVHYRWVGETMSLHSFDDADLPNLPCCKR